MALALKLSMEEFAIKYIGINGDLFTDFEYQIGMTSFTSIAYPMSTIFFYCFGIPLLQRVNYNHIS